MKETVTIEGKEYPVKRFTKAHLASLIDSFRRAISPLGQSQFAEALKRFFIPTLPQDVIEEDFNVATQSSFFTLYVEFDVMGEVIEQLVEMARSRGLIPKEDDTVTISVETVEVSKEEKKKKLQAELAKLED